MATITDQDRNEVNELWAALRAIRELATKLAPTASMNTQRLLDDAGNEAWRAYQAAQQEHVARVEKRAQAAARQA